MTAPLPENIQSYWREVYEPNREKVLQDNIDVDVAVVGGGMAGILTAYFLVERGKRVALLEARDLYSGTTGSTTAKLSAQHNLIYDELINRYGQQTAQLYYQANMEGIALVEELAKDHGISCDLEEQDAFVFTQKQDQRDKFKQEYDAYQKLGIEGAFVEELPLDIDIEAAIIMRHQAQFHPVKFLQGMIKQIKTHGGQVFEQTPVMDLSIDEQITCYTDSNYTVTADDVVLATHLPVYEKKPKFYSSQMSSESSYALAVKSDQRFPGGMYINSDLPKRTIRLIKDSEQDYILIGGESHPTGDGKSTEERYEELAAFAKTHFGNVEILNRWSSHDYIPSDRIPFIGQQHDETKHVYTLTGFAKWGLAASVTGAKVITDQILGHDNPYTKLFSPNRQINELEQTDLDNETPSDEINYDDSSQTQDPEELKAGTGSVVQIDGTKAGAYKDHDGNLYLLDTTCTHLGCDVAWNDGDKTWDCPCHGSRFAATGEVIEGPAVKGLKTFKD